MKLYKVDIHCIGCGKKTLVTTGGEDYYEGLSYTCLNDECEVEFSTKAYDLEDIKVEKINGKEE